IEWELGKGSYGRVLWGALKWACSSNKTGCKHTTRYEFLAQVSMVSRLKHESFVKLLVLMSCYAAVLLFCSTRSVPADLHLFVV
ncbi:hypothetical protein SOVF_138800, partial [Spinacia oleracea]